MKKKESHNLKESDLGESAGPSGSLLGERLFNIVKLILGISLFPFIYASTAAFIQQISGLDAKIATYFWSGVISFVIFHLFVYEPAALFNKGQKILEAGSRFLAPLVKVAPYVLPIYTILLFAAYLIYTALTGNTWALPYFVFLLGSSISLHLVYGAKSLRTRQEDFLKANYIFSFSLVYIINIITLASGFSLLFQNFSVVDFFNHTWQIATGIFSMAFKQLFL